MAFRQAQHWAKSAERRAPEIALLLIGLAVTLRVAAFVILNLPIGNDGAAYLMMADTLARTGQPTDIHGQHAFYSIGYPLALLPAVTIAGAVPLAALITNVALCLLTCWLLWRLADIIGLPRWGALLLFAGYAIWLLGIWNATMPARENLSTPLLLAVLLASLAMLRLERGAALAAGVFCGLAVLAGGSALLLGLAPLTALWLVAKGKREQLVRGGAVLAAGLLIPLTPWLFAVQQMTGTPTLATSSGFNFYLGHNIAATGGFVSIAETPAGPHWEEMRRELGEAGASNALAAAGRQFIWQHPTRALELSAVKLATFWAPNLPDSADFGASRTVSLIRMIEVVQYVSILALAVWALWRNRLARDHRLIIIALIGGFWVVHAAAYVMPRYRDPVVPVLMLMGVAALARRGAPHER